MGLPYLVGVAFAASVSVLTVMLAAVTLLPALLGLAGTRIERGRIGLPGRRDTDHAAAAAHAIEHAGTHEGSPRFARWSRAVQRRPIVASLMAIAMLVGLTAPVAGVRLGFPGAGNDPVGTQSREAFELMAEGFGPGVGAPLQLVARIDGPQGVAPLQALGATIADDSRVAVVSPVQRSTDGRLGLLSVQSRTAATSSESSALLGTIRDDLVPPRVPARRSAGGPPRRATSRRRRPTACRSCSSAWPASPACCCSWPSARCSCR